ncbi:hypothetical protein ASD11_00820 [Aeromicrobium sp. Root495]|uniref:MCE family protein n=1 Tax=Aeromicrobium sp. Root495 TaxID=1736550 RepID=UPI0006F6106D|nr:MCE family protein [Aeromicrobium sp. Root495]KQY58246.1 hypothetical protein ASD11_00820 [Aeromicrobium sp. Root495]
MTTLGAVAAATSLTGCSFTGLNSYSLPFSKGGSGDAVQATVLLENATNLVPNSEVKYGEVTVGSVRKIKLDGWTARLTIGLEKDADVPSDVTAKVAQKSLLGAEYLELTSPSDGEGDATKPGSVRAGPMRDGATIGLERTERYPETEEVLTAASMLFNGGGLPQIKVISQEVNTAFGGRTAQTRSLVRRIDEAAQTLDGQRTSIFGAMEQLRTAARTLNRDKATITRALDTLPEGVEALDEEVPALRRTVESFSRIEKVSRTTLVDNKDGLAEILDNLKPVTQSLAGAGSDLPKVVELLTYPFPTGDLYKYTRSDYLNLFATFRVNAETIADTFIGLTPLDGVLSNIMGLPTGAAAQSEDPLTGPVEGLTAEPGANGGDLPGLVDGLVDGLTGKKAAEQPKAGSKPGPSATPTPAREPNLLERLLGGQ